MKKHILVISQYFYPEQFRINDICKEWIKIGYEVTVITGIPNYPQGKFYQGYNFFKNTKEKYHGINIIRIPIVPRGKNPIMLSLNYLSFVLSGFFWKVFTKIRADYVFIFEVSPMTQALPGIWYGRKKRIPTFIYVQDLWPENVEIIAGVKNKWILNKINKMVDYIYKYSDVIFSTSKSFVNTIVQRGVKSEKVVYLPQYAEEFYIPMKSKKTDKIPDDERFNLIFTGNIGYAQGLQLLPKVAQILKGKKYGNNIRIIIVGDGRYKTELVRLIKQMDVEDIFLFINRQRPEDIPVLLSNSDAAYLSFSDERLFSMTIPAKLQSYLACGIPIIASASGESKSIIENSQSGFCVKTGDAHQLSQAIIRMIKMTKVERLKMGKRGREYYEEYFEKNKVLNKLNSFFD